MEDPRLAGLEKLTVVELKNVLKKMGLKVSGRKAELIERIKEGELIHSKEKSKEKSNKKSNEPLEQSQMPVLPNDMLITIALELELPDLFRFCMSSRRHNDVICKNKMFWLRRLQRDKMGRREDPDYQNIDDYKSYYRARRREYKQFLSRKAIEAAEKGDLESFDEAVKLGAEVDYDGGDGSLQVAAREGHEGIVEYIIENGLTNQYDKDNALKTAVDNRNYEIAKILIDGGADPEFDGGIVLEMIYGGLDRDMIRFIQRKGY